jgi:hypothetical protein
MTDRLMWPYLDKAGHLCTWLWWRLAGCNESVSSSEGHLAPDGMRGLSQSVNLKLERKESEPISRQYSGIPPGGTVKEHENLNQNGQCPGRSEHCLITLYDEMKYTETV